jgi:hypothetical protein
MGKLRQRGAWFEESVAETRLEGGCLSPARQGFYYWSFSPGTFVFETSSV